MLGMLPQRLAHPESGASIGTSATTQRLALTRGPVSARAVVEAVRDPQLAATTEEIRWLLELYNCHSDHVRDVILRHGGPGVDAEDLVQEVFLAAHRKRRLLRAYTEPGAWLHIAALREVWKERRRRRTLRFLSLGMLTQIDEGEAPDAAFQRRELAEWAYQILDRLPERQRQAFLLSQIEGFSSADIGRMCGCPEETIRSRVFLARRAFAKAAARRSPPVDARRKGGR
jgi:RNA polymerase sigma-70 factor, ECF subfamily